MKIETDIELILNEQVRHEFESAYAYLGLYSALNALNFDGFAHWMRKQYREELEHADRLIDYIQSRQGVVKLQDFKVKNFTLKCPCEAFKIAYDLEVKNTKNIHRAYELAVKKHDYPTQVCLQWFITEQVEEEEQCSHYMDSAHRIATKGSLEAMLELDRIAGER
ncbi:MAG: ferritin [Opitutales bacterium]|nr:ferritin [Opitutales bacterium]